MHDVTDFKSHTQHISFRSKYHRTSTAQLQSQPYLVESPKS